MGIMDFFRREERNSIENPQIPMSSPRILEFFGLSDATSTAAGMEVSVESAMNVPAVFAAVSFLSRTMASLPLHTYKVSKGSSVKGTGRTQMLVHTYVNDQQTSFEWREAVFRDVFTHGRSVSYIEKDNAGRPINIFRLDITKTKVKRISGRLQYIYTESSVEKIYDSSEIIDIAFALKSDGITHISPILSNKDTIGLSLAVSEQGQRFFGGGGVPPFVITGNFQSPRAMDRASEDMQQAVRKAAREKRFALTLPEGLKVDSLGANMSEMQMVELKRLLIEDIARIYSLPPIFLQDLTRSTFSNSEQQDLHLVKHLISHWASKFEKHLSLKLFGRSNAREYCEFNLDGLLRGDFRNRMEGYSKAIQNAIMTPNEVRAKENLPEDPEGSSLLIQGATVKLGEQPDPADPQPDAADSPSDSAQDTNTTDPTGGQQ